MQRKKTYRGAQMTAILGEIKEELGDEVEVVSTKRVGNGLFEVEVLATTAPTSLKPEETQVPTIRTSLPPPADSLTSEQLREVLRRQGVHPNFVAQILEGCDHRAATIDRAAIPALSSMLSFDATLPAEKRVVVFVGATGVGKTTTVAKLAANMKLAFDFSVGLVSADNFRVEAGRQLQSYAELLDIPFRQVDPDLELTEGIYRAVKELGRMDLVLVDTSGYSPRDSERVRGLGHSLAPLQWCEKVLVMAAPSNDIDLRTTARAFSPLGCSRVVITKTDETGFMGPVLNTVASLGKPLAFYTTGQRVPEDIEPASAARLAWMLTRTFH